MGTDTADVVDLETRQRTRQLDDDAEQFEREARAERTRDAYRRDFSAFQEWCDEHDADALPASVETMRRYLAHLGNRAASGELKASTIARRLAGIRYRHRKAGHDDPTASDRVREVWRGIRRNDDVQVAPDKALPLLREDIRAMVEACGDETPKAVRDRAVILVGWFGFLRRGELAGLDLGDVQFHRGGAELTIRQSKTDQEGEGQLAWLPSNDDAPDLCPVRALREWLDLLEAGDGALFRSVGRWGNVRDGRISGRTVARILKSRAEQSGFESEAVNNISGHSLRRGAAVQADASGATVAEIQAAGRWDSPTMPLEYAKRGDLRRSSASNVLAE